MKDGGNRLFLVRAMLESNGCDDEYVCHVGHLRAFPRLQARNVGGEGERVGEA
jgi:hypothetical protein